jgi:putative ubiquitin-RnfH superfamily antitoxin RatB of RatAB toxin-antitoxin module
MQITLALALGPRLVHEWTAHVPDGATVGDALDQLPWRDSISDEIANSLHLSLWGRAAQADTALREGDRIELTRPLRVDPKVARRERFDSQGKRTAGLFARKRR